jgi:hypothetical protein
MNPVRSSRGLFGSLQGGKTAITVETGGRQADAFEPLDPAQRIRCDLGPKMVRSRDPAR